jgi:hypothetical protein
VGSLKPQKADMNSNYPPTKSSHEDPSLDDLYQSIRTGHLKLTETSFFRLFDSIRRNLTLAFSVIPDGDHLDLESNSDEAISDDVPLEDDASDFEPSFSPPLGVITKIFPTVGRAVSYVPRAIQPFEATGDPEARQRGIEANFRRAIRTSKDQAIHQDLGVYATLTFDNDSLEVDPLEEFEKYVRRLRDIARIQGSRFHYIAVVTQKNGRPHCHALFSRWIPFEELTYNWPFGFDEIYEIHKDDIPRAVSYLGKNSRSFRYHKHVLLNSKGDRPPVISHDSDTFSNARLQIEETVQQRRVELRSNRPFGKRAQLSYLFEPFDPETNP